ncbi:MAG: HD domain-containing protein [Rhodospirillales bacterium]|nr:HD domain-containing protein [Rhodospirillales bacterium]
MDGNPNHTAPHIFIVNDDRVHREEVRLVLSSLFKVSSFDDNAAAFDAMLTGKPDLVIVDERMLVNGKDLLSDKRRHPDLKSLPFLISGHESARQYISGDGCEADSLLVRPFSKNTVLMRVSDALSYAFEKQWDSLPELEKTTLQSTLEEFQDISKAIEENRPLDLQASSKSCEPLVQSINDQSFHGILDNIRGHHNYTYVHSLRVATYLSIFGHAIGVRDDDLLTLATGGLLHDVGKMVTPQDVLNKSSKLDDAEWQCMKQHVENSSKVYDEMPDITAGIRIIGEQHHEKLDGSGYPLGLKGGQLNELARMSAIVDIFGALTDERSYKPAFPPEMAFDILTEMTSQLDQRLVNIFREVLEGHGEMAVQS